LLRPTTGEARVLGVDSRRLGERELAQIGYVSENQQLPLWMTVLTRLDPASYGIDPIRRTLLGAPAERLALTLFGETVPIALEVAFVLLFGVVMLSIAAVIGRDPSPFLHFVIINRGSNDGVLRGMPVVTDQGLVGRVDAVIADAARVQLITDAASNVNIRLQNAEKDASLVGSVTGDVTLDLIPQDTTIEVGDLVLTSGLGGGYPPDLIVGQVVNIRSRDFDLFKQATVQPVVDFNDLKIVLVIVNFKPVDITPLLPAP